MGFVFIYFFVGMVFTLIMESLLMMTGTQFTMSERIFLIMLWPIGVISLINEILK